MQHSLLSNIQWLQPSLQQYNLANQVQASAKLLPQVIKVDVIHILMEEFMDYCISPLSPDMKSITEADKYWHAVSKIQNLTRAMRYPMLSALAKAILVIPHGNADTERLFSHVGLNKTKLRKSLSVSTLNALLMVQFNRQQKSFEFKPSDELLKPCLHWACFWFEWWDNSVARQNYHGPSTY